MGGHTVPRLPSHHRIVPHLTTLEEQLDLDPVVDPHRHDPEPPPWPLPPSSRPRMPSRGLRWREVGRGPIPCSASSPAELPRPAGSNHRDRALEGWVTGGERLLGRNLFAVPTRSPSLPQIIVCPYRDGETAGDNLNLLLISKALASQH
jgi:hypothetical protein